MKGQTFSASIKSDLSKLTTEQFGMIKSAQTRVDKCCALSFLAAVLAFAAKEKGDKIIIRSENSDLLELCAFVLIGNCNIEAEIVPIKSGFKLLIDETDEIKRIINLPLETEFGFFDCENCFDLFLRGLFLAHGTVLDPEKGYHLSLSCPDIERLERVKELLRRHGINMKLSKTKTANLLYLKDSDGIEDFLIRLGAQKYALKIMELKVEREVKNNETRIGNSLVANLDKSLRSSIEAMKAIEALKKSGKFYSLPDELKETASLREEYPDATLAELSRKTGGVITKSGLNHRLRKLISLADEIGEQNDK